MDTSWPTTTHSVKMITPLYNTKRSSSPNVKVRTFTQRGEAEDLDDSKQRNLENKNPSSPSRRHYDKKRKTERNSTDALEAALNLPSFACAASLLDPMKFSHARAAGSADRQHIDVDLAMVHGVDESSGHFPSTLPDSSPSNGTAGLAAGEVADTADCAGPPPAFHSSSSVRHTYRTYIPILSSEYPLNYLSTDLEPCAAAESQVHYHNHHHHYHDSFSRTGFPIYEDPDDIEIQFQEIRVNVFAPWDEDKENIDEGSWNGEPAEGGGEQHHEDSSTAVTNYPNSNTRNGNTHIFETHDLTLNTNLDTDTDMNMNMDMDLDLDLENITMFPAPENSLSSTPTTQHSMDTNAFNWDVNAHLTTILTTTTGDTNPPSAAFFDEPEATVGPWTHVPDLVAPFPVYTGQELPMDDGTNHAALAPVDEITINPPPEFDFAEQDQVTPDASGLWLPWSAQSLTASEMAALALSVARQREEQMQGDQVLQQIPVQTDMAIAGGKKVRRGTRRLRLERDASTTAQLQLQIAARLERYRASHQEDDTVHFLPSVFRYLPAEGQRHLARDVARCADDGEVSQLAQYIDRALLRPMMATGGGRTTPATPPSPIPDPGVEDDSTTTTTTTTTIILENLLLAPLDSSTTDTADEQLQQLRRTCLPRDQTTIGASSPGSGTAITRTNPPTNCTASSLQATPILPLGRRLGRRRGRDSRRTTTTTTATTTRRSGSVSPPVVYFPAIRDDDDDDDVFHHPEHHEGTTRAENIMMMLARRGEPWHRWNSVALAPHSSRKRRRTPGVGTGPRSSRGSERERERAYCASYVPDRIRDDGPFTARTRRTGFLLAVHAAVGGNILHASGHGPLIVDETPQAP